MSFVQKLKTSSKKAVASAVIGGALSIVFMNGLHSTEVVGLSLPKFVVSAGALGVSALLADQIVPHVTPWIAKLGLPSNDYMQNLENAIVVPVIAGATVLLFEMAVSPQLVSQSGGAFAAFLSGSSASVASYYLLDQMHIISN